MPNMREDAETRASEQRTRLRRMQYLATGLLAAAAALALLARWQGGHTGPWSYVAAFAEAALIGGLADWFAVVALFRRPLGLPIWHTAILPQRRDDVARNLGEFVEGHLVTPAALREHLQAADLASQLALALQRPTVSAKLADGLTDALLAAAPQVFNSLDDARISAWLAERTLTTLGEVDGAALSHRLARRVADEGLHQHLVDGVARGVANYLADPEHLPALSDFLAQALNIDNPMVKSMIKAAAPKAATGLVSLLDELQARPDHPWRLRLDVWVEGWLAQAHDSRIWHARVSQWQHDLLANPSLQDWLAGLWPGVKASLLQGLTADRATLAPHLARLIEALGRSLEDDATLRQRINLGLADASAHLASEHRGAAARFLEQQLTRWSGEEMSEKVELAIGRDLQFIRLNGTLVGGLVGLLLHTLARW